MVWRRCPRCNSGAVVEQSNSCLGCLVGIGVALAILLIFGGITSGMYKTNPIGMIIPTVLIILIPIFFLFLNIKFGYSLYCKSCELHFKPDKK
ncbi:hypothetical protein [Mammaliicoccus sciuri]|uniref:hypothetical protein n=1 Tax=Mammaliicoccus sciuri TaxID=1296 RepID=UPI0021CF804F|nr:hypothetical protein [Mammaliicoccus sciuri]UXV31678.1 hypothetical protein MUA60_12120 [Mammaliicoccus sciuri]